MHKEEGKAFYANLRPKLEPARIGYLTQGTVFNCVKVRRYENCEASGLVVTARCDIAQEKFHILNFIPVVRLADWLERDCLDIIVGPERKDMNSRISQIISDAGYSPSIVNSISLENIEKEYFQAKSDDTKKTKGLSERYQKARKEIEEFETLVSSGSGKSILAWFRENRPKALRRILERLLAHDIAECYMFERLFEERPADPYIALLRDVMSIDKKVAKCIMGGLSAQALENELYQLKPDSLYLNHDELCMPVVCVGSPTIEHLMQRFSTLFSRIGLEDPDNIWKLSVETDCLGIKEK